VLLGGKGSSYTLSGKSSLSWLGIGRKCLIELDLILERSGAGNGQLSITTILKPHDNEQPDDAEWKHVAARIFCDLRAYVMGQGQAAVTAG
jgi:hypothetical protein